MCIGEPLIHQQVRNNEFVQINGTKINIRRYNITLIKIAKNNSAPQVGAHMGSCDLQRIRLYIDYRG